MLYASPYLQVNQLYHPNALGHNGWAKAFALELESIVREMAVTGKNNDTRTEVEDDDEGNGIDDMSPVLELSMSYQLTSPEEAGTMKDMYNRRRRPRRRVREVHLQQVLIDKPIQMAILIDMSMLDEVKHTYLPALLDLTHH